MAKYIGNDLLIQLNAGGVIASIGGSTEDTVTWSNEVVDTTDKSTNRWREITAAGERSATMSLNGFISDDAAFETMRQSFKGRYYFKLSVCVGQLRHHGGTFPRRYL